MSAIGVVLAGLGLFFAGIRLVSSHLQQLASGGIRKLLARTLGRPLVAPLAGFLSGALTQSASASTFVVTGLISAGAIGIGAGLAVLAWSNVGTAMLVLVASFDLRGVVYYLLALAGAAFFGGLDQDARFRHAVQALLGLALLLLGLLTLKAGVTDLRADPWVQEFMEFAGTAAPVGFLIGFVIAVAAQSASVVAVLALPLVHLGVLGLEQTLMLIYGANIGSGAAVLMLSSGLEGSPRQLALCQTLMRALAGLLLVLLWLLESGAGLPGLAAALRLASDDPMRQAALAYLAFQTAVALVALVGARPLLALTHHWSPPSAADTEARPAYLFDEAVADPASALELARREYQRLVGRLPAFLDELRPPEERDRPNVPGAVHRAGSTAVALELEQFLASIVRANTDMQDIQTVFEARARVGALQALQRSLGEFVQELGTVPAAQRPRFSVALVEGLHLILGVAADAAAGDADAALQLQLLTADRGELMERVRQELLGGAASLAGNQALLTATLLFERILWMLRQAAWVRPGQR